jgi:hypothetical protein
MSHATMIKKIMENPGGCGEVIGGCNDVDVLHQLGKEVMTLALRRELDMTIALSVDDAVIERIRVLEGSIKSISA